MTTLRARQIVKEYRVGEASLRVLDGAELTLSAGEELAIVGPSGSGKSTLLYVLGGLDAATSGSVELLGTDLGQLDPGSLADFRNAHLGFVFQDHHLLPQLTALENVALPILARRPVGREDVAWAAQLLGDVGLAERAEHRPPQLSGGERQRVALARARHAARNRARRRADRQPRRAKARRESAARCWDWPASTA